MLVKRLKVAFVQVLVPSYKLQMFQGISAFNDIDLTLLSGKNGPISLANGDDVFGVRNVHLKNSLFQLGPLSFVWQSGLTRAMRKHDYDFVVLPEGVLYLSNYVVMMNCLLRRIPFGFYGHGYNHQRSGSFVSKPLELFRKLVHRFASVLIVYSGDAAAHLQRCRHVAPQRIFIAKNTLDTKQIAQRVDSYSSAQIQSCRSDLNVQADELLLAYVGRVEEIKNPHWVLEAVRQLCAEGHRVKAVFVGTGSIVSDLKERVAGGPQLSNSVSFVGNLPVDQVDRYLASSDICVMPGMTGLAVVHAFAAGKPYVTIESPYHSPEIAYLRNGENGLMSGPTLSEFIDAVRSLVLNPDLRKRLGRAAREDALNELSMECQIAGFRQAFDFIASKKERNEDPAG